MKKLLVKLFSVTLTAGLLYGHYYDNAQVLNVSQVVFWCILALSYPILLLTFIGTCNQDKKDENQRLIDALKQGKIESFLSKLHSAINIVVMAYVGLFWLPIAYFITAIICLIARAMITEAAKMNIKNAI